MKLSRKGFFKGLALGTISLPLFLRSILNENMAQDSQSGPSSISGKRYDWKMVTTWPPNFPILGEGCLRYAEIVREMSGGRINIQVFGGGELVPPLETFDTVRNGGAEMGHGAAYYWAGKIPAGQFFGSVPFGMNAQQLTAWILTGGGIEMWEDLYKDFNLVPMLAGNTGVQMGGWFNREINSIADLKGLKMRIPGLGGKVLEKAGGSPVLLAGSEIYTGLERGVIDATEWIGPFHDSQMGFQDIAKYYYSPGWHEMGTALELIVNKEKFDSLPVDLQAILRSASLQVSTWILSEMETKNAESLATLVDKGIDIRPFPTEVLDQLRIHTEEVIAEIVAKDPVAAKVYKSYDAYRKRAAAWSVWTEKLFYTQIQKTS